MKNISLVVLLSLLFFNCSAQQTITNNKTKTSKPKLVVGIVVDQMRYDYLIRFASKYGDGGFKRLMNGGFNLHNVHYNYSATKTGVGHTSIFTGTTPENHGVMANDYWLKSEKKIVNCVGDNRYKTIGTSSKEGLKSPHRIQTTTIADQLHLSQNMHGKTIGISIKDRGAILPVGHSANAAYWYDGNEYGKWISSSYYMYKLPSWVTNFNNTKRVDTYLSKPWNTFFDITTYTESIEDNNNYEQLLNGEKTPTFPHDLPNLRAQNDNYSLIKETPFGNSLIADFAIEAIKNENLGKTAYTDMLTVSFSSTDYIGHGYGVSSKEVEDAYIRLDRDIARLLIALDNQVGKNNYVLFLTADHGATEVPRYLTDNSIPANYIDTKKLIAYIKAIAKELYNSENIIENVSNHNIFLNEEVLNHLNLDRNSVAQKIVDKLINYPEIYKVITANTLQTNDFTEGILSLVQNSYNQKYSGDIIYMYRPSTISTWYEKGGTTHGTGYNYNTHVPLLFYGKNISKGESYKYHPIIDIAPTVSSLLEIQFPNGSTGNPIVEILE